MHPEIAIAAPLDGIGPHRIDLLRHHADIGLVASVVSKAIVAEPIFQMAQQHNVVLEHDVRSASTAATEAASAPTTEAASAAAAERSAMTAARKSCSADACPAR